MSRGGGGEFRPLNLTPRSASPFLRRRTFDQISSPPSSTTPPPTPTPTGVHPWRHKRIKVSSTDGTAPCASAQSKYKRGATLPDVIDYSDPFSIPTLTEALDRGMYGSVTKDIQDLSIRRFQMLNRLFPSLPIRPRPRPLPPLHLSRTSALDIPNPFTAQNVHLHDDDCVLIDSPALGDSEFIQISKNVLSLSVCQPSDNMENDLQNHSNRQIVIIDSDEEEDGDQIGSTKTSKYGLEIIKFDAPQASQLGLGTPFYQVHGHGDQHVNSNHMINTIQDSIFDAYRKAMDNYQGVVLKNSNDENDENPIKGFRGIDTHVSEIVEQEQNTLNVETKSEKDKGVYVGAQDDLVRNENRSQNDFDDGLGDIWRDMTLALEYSKDAAEDIAEASDDEEGEECEHTFLLKDDIGYVCRVCGVIKRSIETIFDYQWGKASRTTRTRMYESRSTKEREESDPAPFFGVKSSHNLAGVDISIHPRHMKEMKPHQLEGFNFLVKNLISDMNPGGCILAHAPGSGKTFMIISFVQSYLAKDPDARPLVVLPKGILGTWKKEFLKWQVEDIPLYDFYDSKAESRKEQLPILQEWEKHKGILFLGYKQFANIVCKNEGNKTAVACHDILLNVPTILILDEGHTPRNENTDVLHSLGNVDTPLKVVLSGTLFQNHVKEVFNILKLVRPNFLKSNESKSIKRRIMSTGCIKRKHIKAGKDEAFFEVVEETLKDDEHFNRKVAVIQDLREMTKDVLHYYKGDFLDELPGLVDLTVFLYLSPNQKSIVEKLKKLEQFKRTSIGSAVYVHPLLKEFSENATMSDKSCNFNEDKMDNLINGIEVRDGVKAKFFLNILGLCESSGEKLLVFSQYLLPLRFLERLVVNRKGWSLGKEISVINGDTSPEDRERSMEQFNSSSDAKVFFGSIKACGEGISLVGASRILIMDVHLNPSVTRQAVSRAFRPGQTRKVYAYRLVASDSPEEERHNTSFRKELISKMWFEWSEHRTNSTFEMETFNVEASDDEFWKSHRLREDVNAVKKR